MSTVSAVIPASVFLSASYGGLSGVARSVILADLAGAATIWIVGRDAPLPGWETSYAARQRPVPDIRHVTDAAAVPAPATGERRITFPEDRLLTPEGVRALRDGDGANGAACYAGDTPGRMTDAILRSTIKPTDGWVCRRINRPLSMAVSRVLLPAGIGPTPVTWFTLALAGVMVAILVQGSPLTLALGGLLYQAVSVIDGVDGEIARSTYRFSARGALLDTVCDMLANAGFAVGLMIGLIRLYGDEYVWFAEVIVGLLGCAIGTMLVLLRLGPRKGSFDVLRNALSRRLAPWPGLRETILLAERLFKRDAYALFGAVMCMAGLAWTLPPIIVGGLMAWLLAIAWCAPLIAADKQGDLLPLHLRTP